MKCLGYEIFRKEINEIINNLNKDEPSNNNILQKLNEFKNHLTREFKNYERAFNLTGDAIWVLDKNQKILEANDVTKDIFGFNPEDILNKQCYHIAHNTDEPIHKCPFIKMTKTLKREKEVWSIGDKWFEITVDPIFDEKGNFDGAIHVTRDITKQKRAEIELQKQRDELQKTVNLFRTMADTMPDMLWAKDLNKRFIFVNKAICENLLGAKDIEEPIGKTDLYFAERERKSHPENPEWHTFGEICVDSDEVTLRAKKPMRFDEYGNVKGEFLFLDVHKSPMYNEKGEIIGVVGSGRDVTQQKMFEKILRENEARYKELFETAPVGYVILDKNGIILEANKIVLERFGYEENELIGADIRKFVPKEDLQIVDKNIKIILTEGSLDTEVRSLKKNGEVMHLLLREKKIKLPNGEDGILSASIDITEKKRAETELRNREEQLYTLINSTPDDIVAFKDKAGRWLLANDTLLKLFGLKNIEYRGKTNVQLANYVHEVFRQPLLNCLESDEIVWQKKEPLHFVENIITPEGKRYIFDIVKVPLFEKNGNKKGIVFFGRNITKIVKTQQLIKESEEKFRLVWENSIDPMRLQDENERLVFVNEAFCKMVNMKREEIIGKKITEIFKVKKRAVNNYKASFKKTMLPKYHKTEITLPNGEVKAIQSSNSFVTLASGEKLLFTIFRDITEQNELINKLREAKEKAEEINRIKTQFFLYMSHELRTPFMGIIGFAQLLEETAEDEDRKRMATNILETSKRMINTLSNILDLTKIEFDEEEINLKEIKLNSLISNLAENFRYPAENKKLKFTVSLPESQIVAISDEKMLTGIINNLLNNAVKFTEKGEIQISLKQKDDNFVIEVKDTGIGIPKEKQDIIWHEFRQVSEGKSRLFQGTGIGLTIVKKYTEMLGGKVSLISNIDEGSTFVIRIPINAKIKNGGRKRKWEM